ncbi:MAG: DUF1848 family protein [Bacillota bacterium]
MEEKMVLFNKPRIVSVSRRTDIPAFYGEWFMQRVRQGWAVSCNPFSRRAVRVSLRPENVGAFVFWSKNFGPLLPYLAELKTLGCQMTFLYTITGLHWEQQSTGSGAMCVPKCPKFFQKGKVFRWLITLKNFIIFSHSFYAPFRPCHGRCTMISSTRSSSISSGKGSR